MTLKTKIYNILENKLTAEEIAMIEDIRLVSNPLSMDDVDRYYILVAAGNNGYMWMPTGVEPPKGLKLPDPNEEFRKRTNGILQNG